MIMIKVFIHFWFALVVINEKLYANYDRLDVLPNFTPTTRTREVNSALLVRLLLTDEMYVSFVTPRDLLMKNLIPNRIDRLFVSMRIFHDNFL
jgi:hypothetical protein